MASYVQEVGNWSLYVEEDPLQKLPDLRTWQGDGIIAGLDEQKVAAAVGGLDIPVIGTGGGYGWYEPDSGIPYFYTGNDEIARLAAEHLLDQGFTRFAYCGFPRTRVNGWSEERARAFERRIGEAGFSCSTYTGRHRSARKWAELQCELSAWLESLEKPLALMACNDARARHVLEACRTIGARVPEDVAVVGVDNDALMCELTRPPLSSVEQGTLRMGYQSAALLDRIIDGEKVPSIRNVIEPEGLVVRRSSDILAIEDADVADAVRFIREHACEGIQVPDVVKLVQVSRSLLETRFKAVMDRTIHAEIQRMQIQRAKQLIAATDLSFRRVAAQAGFQSVQYLTTVLRQHTGQTPAQYRKRSHV